MSVRVRRLGAAGLILGLVLYRIVAIRHQLRIEGLAGDIDRYFEIASTPGRPYADFSVEYPPLTVLLVDLIHLVAPSRHSFGVGIIGFNVAAEAGIAALICRGFGARVALVFLCLDTLLFDFLLVHLDLASTLLAVGALVAWRRNRLATTGVLLALAAGVKLWPLALIGLLAAGLTRDRRRRFWVGVASAGGALAAGWMLVAGGAGGILQVLGYRGARGWQIESTVGSVLHLFGAPIRHESGAHRIGVMPPGGGPALLAFGVLIAIVAGVAGARRGMPGTAWVVAVGAMLLTSSLFSTQFVVWMLPGAAIAWTEGGRRLLVPITVATILTWYGTFTYGGLLGGDPADLIGVVVRNLAVAIAVMMGAWQLRPESQPDCIELPGRLVRPVTAPEGEWAASG